jgi:hypothetical protein
MFHRRRRGLRRRFFSCVFSNRAKKANKWTTEGKPIPLGHFNPSAIGLAKNAWVVSAGKLRGARAPTVSPVAMTIETQKMYI